MMNQELKGPWIEALRSGRYRQGMGQLALPSYDENLEETGKQLCCLGVLCEINGWDYSSDDGGTMVGPTELIGTYEDPDDLDSDEIPGLSGLTLEDRESLAAMNDSGRSFAEIADKIERAF